MLLVALGSDKLRDTFMCNVLRIDNSQCSVKNRMNMDTNMPFTPSPHTHTQGLGDISKMEIEKNVRVRRWTPHSIAVACTDS